MPGREQHRGADLPRPGAEQDRPGRRQRRALGQRGQFGHRRGVAVHPDRHAVVVQAAAGHDRGPARADARLDAGAVADLAEAAGTVGPQPDFGRLVRRLEQHGVTVDADDAADLQAGRGDGLGVRADQQAAGVLAVRGPHQPAVRGPGRDAGDDLQPGRVGVLAQHLGPAGVGVDGQQPHRPLVPALHHHQRVVLARPAGGHQVGERGPVDLNVRGGAVQPGQQEGHRGVRGAGGRIAHLGGRPLRVGRVGDVPPGDGRLIDPRHQQRRTVRGPPVAAVPVHLLGRDELRQPERHVRGAPRAGQDPVVGGPVSGSTAQAGHPQRPGADVGQPLPGRVGTGIQRRAGHRDLGREGALAGQVDRVDPPGPGEDRHREVRVGGVGHDAAGVLPDPLPAGPLLRRQVRLVAAHRPRVRDQALRAAADVQHPQAGHRVAAAPGSQVGHPGAVG